MREMVLIRTFKRKAIVRDLKVLPASEAGLDTALALCNAKPVLCASIIPGENLPRENSQELINWVCEHRPEEVKLL